MPGIEERMTRELERLGRPVEPEPDAFDRVASKRARRRVLRRVQITSLVVVVLAGTVAGTYGLSRVFRTPSASHPRPAGELPTNGRIAFVDSSEPDFLEAIYSVEPDGTGLTRLTEEGKGYETPAWSPDGSRIAFAVDSDSVPSRYDLYVMNADGTGRVRLTRDGGDNVEPAWSPDGSKIAFTSSRDGVVQVFVMNADGADVTRLTKGDGASSSPAWSPDGSKIAFYSDRDGLNAIYLMNADGTDQRSISGSIVDQEGPYANSPAWSPDGKKIAFVRLQFDRGKNYEIYVMNADGSGATDLTNTSEAESDPVWSPDGRKIAFVRDQQIFLMNPDGTGITQVTSEGSNREPAWQPVLGPAASVVPSPEPTVALSPSPSTSVLPSSCDPSTVTGDFDGDGVADTAMVSAHPCLRSPKPPVKFSLSVEWGGGTQGAVDLPACQLACRALGAVDVNGDGTDELAVVVDRSDSTEFVEFYELPATEAFGQQPAGVGEPGSDGFPAGQPALFPLVGTPTHLFFLSCPNDQSPHVIVSSAAVLSGDSATWSVNETTLRLSGVNAPYGEFKIVSTRRYTLPAEPNMYPAVVGPACFPLEFPGP